MKRHLIVIGVAFAGLIVAFGQRPMPSGGGGGGGGGGAAGPTGPTGATGTFGPETAVHNTNYTLQASDCNMVVPFDGTSLTATITTAVQSCSFAITNRNTSTAVAYTLTGVTVNAQSSLTSMPACTSLPAGCPLQRFTPLASGSGFGLAQLAGPGATGATGAVGATGATGATGGGANVPFNVCFDFRNTQIYVTDDAACAWANHSVSYPTSYTVNGVTLNAGWETAAASSTNRNNLLNHQIAGFAQAANSGTTPAIFRIDVPAAGTYKVSCAASDTSNSGSQSFIGVDSAATLFTVTALATDGSVNQIADCAGVLWTATLWPGNNLYVPVTMATTIFRLKIGGQSGTSNTSLQTLRVVRTP